MRKALAPVLARAGYSAKDVDIKGPPLGLRFVLKHREHSGPLARDFVENVMDARREPGGGWTSLTIQSPAGEAITVYVGRDVSHAQRRTAWHLARAARALRDAAPRHTFEVAKAASAVVHQWKELATCRYDSGSDSTEISWKVDAIKALGIDEVQVQRAYSEMV